MSASLKRKTHLRFLTALILLWLWPIAAVAQSPLDQRPQPWVRRDKPILSARTATQDWRRIVCYSPHVIYHDGRFRMWYLGTSEASRTNDMQMGYAESENGIDWKEHPGNPILSGKDVPWGRLVQTPFVLFDHDRNEFRMWFVSGDGVKRDRTGSIVRNHQQLAYATSSDGIRWKVHLQPLFPSGRSPSVVRIAKNDYRMWMGSRPDLNEQVSGLYDNIFAFSSTDGILWKRGKTPVLRPRAPAKSTVYPFVMRVGEDWYMWHGCHVDGGRFELFCAKSADGERWDVDHTRPAFAAREGKTAFDSKYTSTPCIVRVKDRLLLYYSARDWQLEYVDADGRKRRDGAGVYSHIGVAELKLP